MISPVYMDFGAGNKNGGSICLAYNMIAAIPYYRLCRKPDLSQATQIRKFSLTSLIIS